MSIIIKINHFNGEEIGECDLNYKSANSLLGKMVEDIIKKAGELKELKEPEYKLDFEEANRCQVDKVDNVEIDLILANNDKIKNIFNVPNDSIGFHAINSGSFEEEDGDIFAAKHRIFVLIDEGDLRGFMEFAKQNDYEEGNFHNPHEVLFAYLVTITHELAHCVEFIENANGMTPSEIYNANSCGDLSLDVEEVLFGKGVYCDKNTSLSLSQMRELTERRVEEKGINWLDRIELDQDLFEKCISEYSVRKKSVEEIIEEKNNKNNVLEFKRKIKNN